jgi:hypothetical protein
LLPPEVAEGAMAPPGRGDTWVILAVRVLTENPVQGFDQGIPADLERKLSTDAFD